MTHLRPKRQSAPTEAHQARGADDDTESGRERASFGGPPRWVVVLGVAVAFGAVLLVFVLHLTGVLGPGAH